MKDLHNLGNASSPPGRWLIPYVGNFCLHSFGFETFGYNVDRYFQSSIQPGAEGGQATKEGTPPPSQPLQPQSLPKGKQMD
jgi:hypothetical protein